MSLQLHDGRITHTDRIAMSNALYALAERFGEQAQRWKPQSGVPDDMRRQARLLAEVARAVLSPIYPYAKAEAFYEAGDRILANERAAWEFFRSVLTPPTRKG